MTSDDRGPLSSTTEDEQAPRSSHVRGTKDARDGKHLPLRLPAGSTAHADAPDRS